jgi:hypothetical protein
MLFQVNFGRASHSDCTLRGSFILS